MDAASVLKQSDSNPPNILYDAPLTSIYYF